MCFSFKKYIEERFLKAIIHNAESFVNKDSSRKRIRNIKIYQIDTNVLLHFEDYVELTIIIKAMNPDKRPDSTQCTYIKGYISGTFSLMFSDFNIMFTEILPNKPQKLYYRYTDELLPRYNYNQIDIEVEKLIYKSDCSISLNRPYRISPLSIAHNLGIRVFYAAISLNGEYKGAYIFSDTYIKIYDNSEIGYHFSLIKGKSIIIDVSLKRRPELMRYTLMHELIHAYTQRFAFCLLKMYNQELKQLRCSDNIYYGNCTMDIFLSKAERQAETMASLLFQLLHSKKAVLLKTKLLLYQQISSENYYQIIRNLRSILQKVVCASLRTISLSIRRSLFKGTQAAVSSLLMPERTWMSVL